MTPSSTNAAPHRVLALLAIGIFGALLTLAMTRGVIDHAPKYDELLHIEAAKGVLKTGEPIIAEGIYPRAELYTRLTASAMRLGDGSLVAARVPALLSGMVLVSLLGVWVGYRAGILAGFASAGFLAITPLTIELSVFARFYTLHALAVLLMLIAFFEATFPISISKRTIWLASAVAAITLALHLQISTLVALGAGFCGVVAALLHDQWILVKNLLFRYPWQITLGLIVLALLGCLAISHSGLLERLGDAPLWAADRNVQYYNTLLREQLPLLWPLLPLLAAIAVTLNPRLSLFCVAIVVSAFIVHSLAAQKTGRYFYYAMPFVAALLGCGLASMITLASRQLQRLQPGLAGVSLVGAVLLAVICVGNSAEGIRAAKLLIGKFPYAKAFPGAFEADWARAVPSIVPFLAKTPTLVTSSGIKALYFLGRYDFELNASVVPESESGEEFGRDARTGRRVISTSESLAKVIAKPGAELIVADSTKVGNEFHIGKKVVDLIQKDCSPLDVPAESAVSAWICPDYRE